MSKPVYSRQQGTTTPLVKRSIALLLWLSAMIPSSLWANADAAADRQDSTDPEVLSAQFEEARKLYDLGQYDSAASVYEHLLALGYRDFALHYNLGNAYFKAGHLGPSILHYERALLLEPKNPSLLHNLDLAYLRQADKRIEPLPRHFFSRTWSAWTSLFSQTAWAWMTVALAWMVLGGFALLWWSEGLSGRRAGLFTLLAGFVGLLLALSGAFGRQQLDKRERFAIIMAPSALLKSAPSAESTDLYILREGFKLQVISQTGNWVEVMLPDGNVAWVDDSSIETI
jgi:tetratricopeptide (TPR) repeat protein